jgi:hypothetical protein
MLLSLRVSGDLSAVHAQVMFRAGIERSGVHLPIFYIARTPHDG